MAAALALFCSAPIAASCGDAGGSGAVTPETSSAGTKLKITGFTSVFSGDNAFRSVGEQVALGPRTSVNGKQKACRDYIAEKLRAQGFDTSVQEFVGVSGAGAGKTFYNVIGKFDPAGSKKFKMFGAHYDTLPCAPRDPDPSKQSVPIDGANDGASGTAVLVELARVAKVRSAELKCGVELVFFDGEDYSTGTDNMFYGSKYFAGKLTFEEVAGIKYFVLADMIGDTDLEVYKDINSNTAFPQFTDHVFSVAAGLGIENFKQTTRYEIIDDHLPIIARGITSTLLIDFDYTYWHTTQDTLERVSAASLGKTGRILEYLIVFD